MSVEVIKEQIFQFLSSSEPEVMAIKGEWGIGKTFSWKKFLKDASSEVHISEHSDQSFRDYPITHFGLNRSLIPRLSDHF